MKICTFSLENTLDAQMCKCFLNQYALKQNVKLKEKRTKPKHILPFGLSKNAITESSNSLLNRQDNTAALDSGGV